MAQDAEPAPVRDMAGHTSTESGAAARRRPAAPGDGGAGDDFARRCAMNTATYGAARADAGVASAMVNTCQQVGGSVGTALLNTIAASALSSYLVAHGNGPAAVAAGAVHSYAVAFWVSAGVFAGTAIICALVLRPGVLAEKSPETTVFAAA